MLRAASATLLAGTILLGGMIPVAAADTGTTSADLSTTSITTAPAATTPERAVAGQFPYGIALALDPSGYRHLVAGSSLGHLWYATDRSGSWQAKRILTGEVGSLAWAKPSITTDERGRVHIAVVATAAWDTPSSTGGIWYLTDRGRARGDFGPRTRIAGAMMTNPSLRVVRGVRYLAYDRCLCGPGDTTAPLFFKTDRLGRWTKEQIAAHGLWPSVRVGSEGRARIAYTARSGVRYTTARTRLGDFSAPVRIPGSGNDPTQPSLALDGLDRPHVAWASQGADDRVKYSRRTADGWSTPRALGPGLDVELSLDASNRPHVVIAGLDWVRHRWLARGTWQRREVARAIDPTDVDIRAFGRRAWIAWAQYDTPRGAWVVRD